MNTQPNTFARRAAWAKAVLGGLLALGTATTALAQTLMPSLDPQEQIPMPRLQPEPQAPLLMSPLPPPQQSWVDPGWTPAVETGNGVSFWDTIKQSVFGQRCGLEWTPLCGGLTGICDPWLDPGPGSSGAPRQTWVNTFDGFLTRQAYVTYTYTSDLPGDRDFHHGQLSIETPLSRRLWLGVNVPFIDSLQGGRGPSTSHFGDVTITPKYLLYESRDFSLSTGLTVRTPTGTEISRGDRTTLLPFVAFWSDLGRGVSLRGGTGLDIAVDNNRGPDGAYIANLSLGQTLTHHEAAPLGDFTYYLAANLRQEFGENSSDHTFLTLTPGIRTHLGRDWSFLAGYEFPIIGPKPFDDRLTLILLKGW
jgi:hypothetical protein